MLLYKDRLSKDNHIIAYYLMLQKIPVIMFSWIDEKKPCSSHLCIFTLTNKMGTSGLERYRKLDVPPFLLTTPSPTPTLLPEEIE